MARKVRRSKGKGSSAGCAPGFSILAEKADNGAKVFRILLHGKRIPSADPRGKYALTAQRAAQLTYSLNPQTGKRYRPWDK